MALGTWRLRIPAERLAVLRADEAFQQVLALGRFLNSLRFCHFAMHQWKDLDSPAGKRQRNAVFFIAAGLLHEGLQLLQRMGKHFRGYASWTRDIQPILADKLVEQLLSTSIIPTRNLTIFHFGESAFKEPLATLDQDDLVLASGDGWQQGEVYYELSDLLAYHLFIGAPPSSIEGQLELAKELLERTVMLTGRLTTAGEALVNEYCTNLGMIAEIQNPDGTWRAA